MFQGVSWGPDPGLTPYPPPASSTPELRSRGKGPWLGLAAAIGAGYLVVGSIAGAQTFQEFTRVPTPLELDRAAAAEVERRWRDWPAGRIFPDQISYEPEQGGDPEQATRVGIAPGTRCSAAVDAKAAEVLRRHGCRAVLRATYLDEPQGVVVTLGVTAFADPAAAGRAGAELPGDGKPSPGLRAVGFPDTVTARFGDAARQASFARQGGPYLVLATAGQPDGRPAKAVEKRRKALFEFAPEMAARVGGELARPVRPDCADSAKWAC